MCISKDVQAYNVLFVTVLVQRGICLRPYSLLMFYSWLSNLG